MMRNGRRLASLSTHVIHALSRASRRELVVVPVVNFPTIFNAFPEAFALEDDRQAARLLAVAQA
jgi:hypothetical protein